METAGAMRTSQGADGWLPHAFDNLEGAQGSTIVRSGVKDERRGLGSETAAYRHGAPILESLDPSGPLPGDNKVGGLRHEPRTYVGFSPRLA